MSQGSETTAGKDVENFVNSLKASKTDLSTFSLLQQYFIYGLKNRISPEMGISGVPGTIQFDELFKRNLNQSIDREKVCKLLGDSISETEIKELITKMEEAKSEWSICALEYGKAVSICVADQFGDDINIDNFTPCQSSGKTISPDYILREAILTTASCGAAKAEEVKRRGLLHKIFGKRRDIR